MGKTVVKHYAPTDPRTGNERAKCRGGISAENKIKSRDVFLALPKEDCCSLCRGAAERERDGKPNGKLGRYGNYGRTK